ncbi:MAG: hypothetical protein IKQ37_04060 [Bacteroidaceae bacterium]|nr:hypothetical protein [Bacteroidaceae bacterium]
MNKEIEKYAEVQMELTMNVLGDSFDENVTRAIAKLVKDAYILGAKKMSELISKNL